MSTQAPVRTTGSDASSVAAKRGRLTLSDGVVEKIAAQVVAEVSSTHGAGRRSLELPLSRGPRRAAADVDLFDSFADLRIRVGLDYPVSIRTAVATIRERVVDRVGHLTGIRIRRVDVTVDVLHPLTTPASASGGFR